MSSFMKKPMLAIKGGYQIVNKKYQYFIHPQLSNKIPTRLLKDSNFWNQATSFDSQFITQLQEKVKELFNLKYVLATNSGTSAIFEMYYALGLKQGDEVIVPVYTFFATATPLFVLGCKPILADCLDNGNIDPKDIRKKITKKTKAIIITHMWGIPCDMDGILKIAEEYKLPILEDSSHAHGATYKGKIIGTFGKASAWSLGSKKIVTGGQGGILGTNNEEIYQKSILVGHANNKRIREINLPQLDPYAITGTGLNLRMHPFSAAIIYEQFQNLGKQLEEKREVAKYMSNEIDAIDGLNLPRIPEDSEPAWYAFPILYSEEKFGITKEKFVEALVAEGAVEIDIPHSTCPLIEFETFILGNINFNNTKQRVEMYSKSQFKNAQQFHHKLLKLPVWYGSGRMEYAKAYIGAIKKVVANIDQLK